MTRAGMCALLLLHAGQDYRFARAIFEMGCEQQAVRIGLKAARVTFAPTASQRNGKQGKP